MPRDICAPSATIRPISRKKLCPCGIAFPRSKKSRRTLPRLLVTGGAGFIGSHVAHYFLDKALEGHIVDDLSTRKRANIPRKAKFHQISGNNDEVAPLG